MSYTPSKHTTSNKPYGVQGLPDGARAYYYEDVNFYKYRPFLSREEALAYFDVPAKRTGHFSVIINTGGVLADGVLTGGTNDEYWFKDGVLDIHLVIKQANVDLSNFPTEADLTALLALKVDKVEGLGLSANSFTNLEKDKLAAILGSNTGDQDLSPYATIVALSNVATNLEQADAALTTRINAADAAIVLVEDGIDNIISTLLPLKADDNNVVHRSIDETIQDIKTFVSSPLVPVPTSNAQAMNLQAGRALPRDGVFSRNIGIIAKDQAITVTAGYSRNFLQITPANNYTHVKLFITAGDSQVRAYEFQAGYDALNSSWKQLAPYLKYQDRANEFEIDIRAVDGFGPTTFGILFRVRGITGTRINYRIEYHQETPALGGDYEDYTKLFQAEYLTTTQPVSGLYPYQNEQATKTYVNQQDSAIIASITPKADKADVGDKISLTTTDKTTLVAAINEVDARSKIITNSFQVVNLLAADNVTVRAQITTDSNGNVLIKSATGEIMLTLFQDGSPDEGLVDPGMDPGFPYTFPYNLS